MWSKYVEETKQRLEKQIQQHQAALRRGNLYHSDLTEHGLTKYPSFWADNVRVIKEKLPYFKEQRFQKSVHIRKTPSNCNRDIGIHIPDIYLGFLDT